MFEENFLFMRTLIIDDEPNAREKLAFLLQKFFPQIEIKAVCKDAEEGIEAIALHSPELVFLDVEMPMMTGFDMLKVIKNTHFEVVFTTAHDHYALKAIKHSALDYLIKPIELAQLQLAVERALDKTQAHSRNHIHSLMENMKQPTGEFASLAIPTLDGFLFIHPQNIIRLASDGRYTTLYMDNNEKHVASKNLGSFEEMLSETQFLRIHHSHLINIRHVRKYIRSGGGQVVMSDHTIIDISRRKKEEILQKLLLKG